MSLAIMIKGTEGIVLAADSRVSLGVKQVDSRVTMTFDHATKVFSFSPPHNHVGLVTYGAVVIGLRTAHSFLPELEQRLPDSRCSIEGYATIASEFYQKRWNETPVEVASDRTDVGMTFLVGGYDAEAPYASVYSFTVPSRPKPVLRHPGPGEGAFGILFGGQAEIAARILYGVDLRFKGTIQQTLPLSDAQVNDLAASIRHGAELKIPYHILSLQECVDLATLLIRTTIGALSLSVGPRGVGGPIDVAIITRKGGFEWIQRKAISVEGRA